jgi:TonB family protein
MALIRYIPSRSQKMPPFVRAVIFCLIVAIPPIPLLGQTDSQTNTNQLWGKYTGKGEEFSVRMPRQPGLYSNLITSRSGKQIPERIYSTYADGVVYFVVSYDRPSLKEIFENFRLHHCTQAKITATSDKSLAGLAGKEYSLKLGDVVGTVDVYVTKKRGYAVAIVQAVNDVPLRDYFLSTFSLTETEAPIGGPSTSSSTAPPQFNSNEIAGGKQTTRKPVLVSKPEPSYTEEARNAGITGTVVLRVIFSSTGEVTNIRVVNGLSKGLTETAIEAARHVTFIPGTKDGAFISYWMELQYNFGLY